MQDIKFIKNSDTVDFKTQTAKEYILLKIKKFVSEQFPGMTIDNSSVVISKERKPIS